MKKTLIALSVLVAAGSVNAAEMYNKDGFTLDVSGQVEVLVKKTKVKDAKTEIELDDADLNVTIGHQVNDDVKAIGYFGFDGSEQVDGTRVAKMKEMYAGFESASMGTLTVGAQYTALDDSGIGGDKEFGISANIESFGFYSEQLVKYSYDNGTFYAKASTVLDGNDDTSFMDGKIGFRPMEGLDVRAFFGTAKDDAAAATKIEKATMSVFQVEYTADAYYVEVGYFRTSEEYNGAADQDQTVMAIGAGYTMGDVTFNAGWSVRDYDNAADDKLSKQFVNAVYSLTPKVSTYVELGFGQGDSAADKAANDEMGYALGMAVKF